MYRGEFLPELAGEEWVAIESCKYQKLYVDCINELPLCCGKDRSTKNFWNLVLRPAEFTFSRNII